MVRSATSRSSSLSSSSFFLLSFFRCCLPLHVPADAAPPERPLTRFFAMCNDLKERPRFTGWGRQVLARASLHTTTVFLPSLLIPFSRSSCTEGDRSRGGRGEEKGRDKREERNKATIIIHHGLFNYYTLFPPFSFCFCSNVPSSTPLHSYRYSFDGAIKMFPPFPHLLLAKALYGHPSSSFASYSSLSRSSHRHRFLFFFFFWSTSNEHPLSDTACEGISGVSWSGHSASRRRKSAKNLAFHPSMFDISQRWRGAILRHIHRGRLTISFSLRSSFGWRGVNTRISAICSGEELRFIGICTRAWNPIRFWCDFR